MAGAQERIVNVWDDKIKAHVKVAGSGPALVFLHGGWGPQWTEFHDTLARDFTVYAPDHPGTSDGDPESHRALDDMWDLALFYDELFDKLGLDKPALVGHSFGGMVAGDVAANFPKRVGKLVLIDSLGIWLDDSPIRNYMVTPITELVPMIFANPSHPSVGTFVPNPTDTEAMVRTHWALGCTGKFCWPLPDKGLRKRIHRVTAPTLVLWGKQDHLVPAAYAHEFVKLIKGAKVELIDQASHMLPIEQPAAAAKAVADFVKR
jgi:pimeloyl-ACP methyl ester carboxylesterase